MKTTGVYQSLKFGYLCSDLVLNFDENRFNTRIQEVHRYLSKHPDIRLQVRLFMYERLAFTTMKVHGPDLLNTAAHYLDMMKRADVLKDEQLLSELYGKYAELCEPTENLYYLLKCIQIREHIGLHYFTDISAQYRQVSTLLYAIADYENSAVYAAKGLTLYKENDKQDYRFLYILTADLAGASYLKINKPDSALYYYRQVGDLIEDCMANPEKYKSSDMNLQMLEIWKGVVKGGIAKAYILQKKYDAAYSLLAQNLASSARYQQWDDMAGALNALAKIDALRQHMPLALSRYRQAYGLALKNTTLSLLITSSGGLAAAFAVQRRYDSAYVYHQRYLQWKTRLDDKVNNSRLDMIKAQVDFEKMQKELLLSQNNVIDQKRIRNFILMAIAFLTVIALLLYNRKQLRMGLQYEKLEKEKQRSVMEMGFAQQQINSLAERVAEKNKLIKQIQSQVLMAGNAEISTALHNMTIITDKDWQKFKSSFEIINPGFLDRLKQKMPGITLGEQRIIVLAKIGFNTKEMAAATGVSSETIRSVSSRMRKKFGFDVNIHDIANDV